MPNQPGLQDVPGRDALRPNPGDCDPSRGALAYANPLQTIGDFGAPPDPARPWNTTSPARATPAPPAAPPKEPTTATIQFGIARVR